MNANDEFCGAQAFADLLLRGGPKFVSPRLSDTRSRLAPSRLRHPDIEMTS